ncbi:hypothetical protein SARC_11141 [Sphaeroforma arctica JP610]|uniref:Mitochondrial carrier protein n=1 Tax=Sphaeroforma arctica JP610 TaxID=667725 RepID=A0A0L0FIQ0_9EUKA|nr:hypothetical protein SARC_11141 [Sphaeroforma arctica JP610]KNC76356.1 hypothetical protein SARC_11141 [Sphaeroforma arctica JP610]|eukprot:XP_014150258.1 hypothetical protein SARC_11141 [Sphaeroforma arctica JP610]
MYQTDGFAGFFKGNGINILRMIPYTGIQISAYESYKRVFSSDEAELSSPLRLTSGALAGMTAAVLTYPLDIIRTRMTLYSIADTSSVVSGTGLGSGGALVAPTRYNSVYDCGQKIMYESGDYAGRSVTELKRNGQKGSPAMLFRGLTPSMLGVMPYVALNFALYEVLKVSAGTLSGADPHAEMGVGTRLTCAALAGALSQTVTYPLDVIKRRMQVMEMSSSRYHYTGVLDAFKTIKRSESWRGLYRGLLANYIKVVPSITASYFTYEYCKRLLLV